MDKRVIAHVDMDCFFAACELQKNPNLRGKPVVIGGVRGTIRGVVSTANYEARQFGVHSAMPSALAEKKCPDGIFLNGDMAYYKNASKRIMHLLSHISPVFQQTSIDEAYIDITHLVERKSDWMKIAKRIRSCVYHKTGYTCSVGVSESTTVAKIASGHQKPSGITIVHDPKRFLSPLPIGTIPGIGKKSVPHYNKLGIQTIMDFAKKDIFFILQHFGKQGIKIHKLANGEYFNEITLSSREKSISNETTFEEDIVDQNKILLTLQHLALKTYNRLREYEYKTVSIKIRFSDFHTITRSFTFAQHGKSLSDILIRIQQLFSEHINGCEPIRLVGVKLEQLHEMVGKQQTLFAY